MANPKIDKQDVVKELILSSLDFFNSSIEELSARNSKFSMVHFSTALELALKTKIASQHWALLLEKINKDSFTKFDSGDFMSIQASNLVDRINGICAEGISDQEKEAYKKIFDHRNKIMHCYHAGLNDSNEIIAITTAEVVAWYYISKRLRVWADNHLRRYKRNITTLIKKMAKLDAYKSAIFAHVKSEIDKATKSGLRVFQCGICNQLSMIESKVGHKGTLFSLIRTNCAVCSLYSSRLIVECPDCGNFFQFYGLQNSPHECQSCGKNFYEKLNTYAGLEVESGGKISIHCQECGAEKVVQDSGDFFVCLECGHYGKETDACEWCGAQFFAYDSRGSYTEGCALCDGVGTQEIGS